MALLEFNGLLACGTTIALAIIVSKLLSWWSRYRKSTVPMKDIDGDPPHWLFGHIFKLRPGEAALNRYLSLIDRFPRCQPFWIGPFSVTLRGYHPDFMRTILSTDEPKSEIAHRFLHPWIGGGLLTSHGAKWKRNRRLLTPAFHFDILKKYIQCMNEATAELLSIWNDRLQGNVAEVEMFHDISRMTLDNILRCLVSKQSGCQREENNEYLQAVKYLTEATMNRVLNPLYIFDFIFYLTPSGRNYKRALDLAHGYTAKFIKERKKLHDASDADVEQDMDFLDILLRAKDNSGKGLSHQEICDEMDTFIFGGHDTVSSGISWAMYNLAIHPEFQDQCREEVNEVLNEKPDIAWSDLPKFKFLTMFIKESLRLYPPAFSIGRSTSKPVTFERGFGDDFYNSSANLPPGSPRDFSRTFPENTNFSLNIQVLHRNPHIWQDPGVFDPYRFTLENSSKRSPHAYVPFSAGPRNCIGQNFAMAEIKVALARTLKEFRIRVNEEMPKPVTETHLVLRSKTGIHLKLQRIIS